MRGQRVGPFFCRARAQWVPYVLTWDPETGAIRGAEGPRGFDSYREAVEASRFLMLDRYTFQVLG